MNVNLSKHDIINMIKSVPVAYRRCKPELDEMGEWEFNMDGPTHFVWYNKILLTKSEEYLYDFYQKLKRGDFYLPEEEKDYIPQPVEVPFLRRTFPVLNEAAT
jgi:hypothetical protein